MTDVTAAATTPCSSGSSSPRTLRVAHAPVHAAPKRGRIGLVFNGVWSQYAFATAPKYAPFYELIYVHDLSAARVRDVDALVIPFQSNHAAIAARQRVLYDVLADRGTVGGLAHLLVQFVDAGQAGARHGLVGAGHEADQAGLVVQRLEHRHRRHRGAVGVGDDPLRRVEGQGTVHLVDHERHVGVHPERRRVVDDGDPGAGEARRQLSRGGGACGEQGEIETGGITAGDVLDEHLSVPEAQRPSGRACRCEVPDLIDGELALVQQPAHHAADLARGSDDCDAHVMRGYCRAPPAVAGSRSRCSTYWTVDGVGCLPMTGTGTSILHQLEPAVEGLLDRHLSRAQEWFPHELVPYSRGRDFAAGDTWSAADADLGCATIDDAVRSALYVNLLTEDNLPYYFRSIERMFGRDGAWGEWSRRWTAEEGRHAMAIYGYVTTTRAIDPIELERGRMVQVSRGETPEPHSELEGFVYLTLQELATRISHRNTGTRLGDPVGPRRDEAGGARREPAPPVLTATSPRRRSRWSPAGWSRRWRRR